MMREWRATVRLDFICNNVTHVYLSFVLFLFVFMRYLLGRNKINQMIDDLTIQCEEKLQKTFLYTKNCFTISHGTYS